MNKAHLLACINAAQLAGFSNYAAALLALYRSLPDERALPWKGWPDPWLEPWPTAHLAAQVERELAAERAERDGRSTRIST